MAVTIKDVAALAGVSPSTVSRTCNNSSLISKKTKERVRKAMEELGYEAIINESENEQPAIKGAIGIILPYYQKENLNNPFFLDVIRGISHTCNQYHYTSCLLTGKNETELLEAIDRLRSTSSKISFILMFSQQFDPVAEYLYDENLDYVVIGSPWHHETETISVDNDNFAASYDATQYLIDHHHERIGFIGTDPNLAFSARRKQGYQMALIENELPLDPSICLESNPDAQAIKSILTKKNRPTAFVIFDDAFALATKQICNELGYNIPEDISIISFNNSIFAELSVPQLTSIDIHSRQLGIEATVQAINHLEAPDLTASKVIVPYEIVERESVKRKEG